MVSTGGRGQARGFLVQSFPSGLSSSVLQNLILSEQVYAALAKGLVRGAEAAEARRVGPAGAGIFMLLGQRAVEGR